MTKRETNGESLEHSSGSGGRVSSCLFIPRLVPFIKMENLKTCFSAHLKSGHYFRLFFLICVTTEGSVLLVL